jgi:hypothetical protein
VLLGRNTLGAGGIFTLDTSLGRAFTVAEAVKLVVRLDAFDTLNRANFAIPVCVLEAPAFGQAVATSTPNRQLQIVAQIRSQGLALDTLGLPPQAAHFNFRLRNSTTGRHQPLRTLQVIDDIGPP